MRFRSRSTSSGAPGLSETPHVNDECRMPNAERDTLGGERNRRRSMHLQHSPFAIRHSALTRIMPKRLRLTIRAHAKVNLDLRVLGTRPDGYHELRTVLQSIELHDTLTCVERPGAFALKCRLSGVPLDDSNLVWRAAAALWQALGREGDP